MGCRNSRETMVLPRWEVKHKNGVLKDKLLNGKGTTVKMVCKLMF